MKIKIWQDRSFPVEAIVDQNIKQEILNGHSKTIEKQCETWFPGLR